ncbi:MAG TPA: hypothetical protein VMY78_06210 [Solirubrobacteraceae bacterium]|nr:hypothetical protein [Solirubrobacteraceae bacterium]
MATTLAARDSLELRPSSDPDVHRPLVVVDAPMEGRDIAELQRATRAHLQRRDAGGIDAPVRDHGRFTPATAAACIEAQYLLGVRADAYLMRDRHGNRVLTAAAQRVIRDPGARDGEQLARAQAREAQLDRGPYFYAQLAAEMGMTGSGPMGALAYAATHVGIKERPPGSCAGPAIDEWIRLAGYRGPVPWAGCFVNACLVAGGVPSGAAWGIGFAPSILARAQALAGGWSWHGADGRPGDLALFAGEPGDDDAIHVELVRAQLSSARYSTYGADRSGMVVRRDRPATGALRIIGFARAPWRR